VESIQPVGILVQFEDMGKDIGPMPIYDIRNSSTVADPSKRIGAGISREISSRKIEDLANAPGEGSASANERTHRHHKYHKKEKQREKTSEDVVVAADKAVQTVREYLNSAPETATDENYMRCLYDRVQPLLKAAAATHEQKGNDLAAAEAYEMEAKIGKKILNKGSNTIDPKRVRKLFLSAADCYERANGYGRAADMRAQAAEMTNGSLPRKRLKKKAVQLYELEIERCEQKGDLYASIRMGKVFRVKPENEQTNPLKRMFGSVCEYEQAGIMSRQAAKITGDLGKRVWLKQSAKELFLKGAAYHKQRGKAFKTMSFKAEAAWEYHDAAEAMDNAAGPEPEYDKDLLFRSINFLEKASILFHEAWIEAGRTGSSEQELAMRYGKVQALQRLAMVECDEEKSKQLCMLAGTMLGQGDMFNHIRKADGQGKMSIQDADMCDALAQKLMHCASIAAIRGNKFEEGRCSEAARGPFQIGINIRAGISMEQEFEITPAPDEQKLAPVERYASEDDD
jgi:hypothetical protein